MKIRTLRHYLPPPLAGSRTAGKIAGMVFIGLGIFVVPAAAHAADRYWVGAAGASFNSASNWASADPGSCTGGGAGVPGTSDVAIFGADCDNGLSMNSGYTGTELEGYT